MENELKETSTLEVKQTNPEGKPNRFIEILKTVQAFLAKTTNGMAIGLFGTLIIGTIIALFAKIPGMGVINDFANVVKGLMGAGIGLGVALSLQKKGVSVVAVMAAGAVGNYAYNFGTGKFSSISDPLSCYFAAIIAVLAISTLTKKKTPVDLILIPLVGLLFAMAYSFLLSFYVHYITIGLGELIRLSFDAVPYLMGLVVAVLVGMALTAPISSVAICVAINIGSVPLAAGAALVGCCAQMVGFAVETAYDNKWGSVLAVGIGTSMLQFKNIVKKPIIWLPTILTSAILSPFAIWLGFQSDSVGAGMGTSGLVGLINTFDVMQYDGLKIFLVLLICVIAPIILTFLIDFLFRRLGWIKKGDFSLSNDI